MLVKAKPLQVSASSCRRYQLSEFLDVEAGEFNGVTVVLQADADRPEYTFTIKSAAGRFFLQDIPDNPCRLAHTARA